MKRLAILWLVLIMLFSTTALASESVAIEDYEWVREENVESLAIEPRFTYLAHMTIGLGIEEDGYLAYSGSACAPYYKLRITIYLQRSTNQLFWDELEVMVKTGTGEVMTGSSRTVPADDYYYRAKIVAEVLDSNRNVLETATAYSDSERY